MNAWNSFAYISLVSVAFWSIGAWMSWRKKPVWAACLFTALGSLVYLSFIVRLWICMERPPMVTMGETRMWYSFFLPLVGVVIYWRWRYRWILAFSTFMSIVFVGADILCPEIHGKALMPALQSAWFVPHVTVYMFAYAMMGAATLIAVWLLCHKRVTAREMELTDNLVCTGLAFLTLGMLFGALWAKEAWGHYWSWDPKETWAAATWLAYLAYIHFRMTWPSRARTALWILVAAFMLLQMCWWGINCLPGVQDTSFHSYG